MAGARRVPPVQPASHPSDPSVRTDLPRAPGTVSSLPAWFIGLNSSGSFDGAKPLCCKAAQLRLSKGMSDLTKDSPEFAVEMGRMQLDVQMGREPDAQRMGQLADKLEQSYEKWSLSAT